MSGNKASKCRRGHRLSGANLIHRGNGFRQCKKCSAINLRKWRKSQKCRLDKGNTK